MQAFFQISSNTDVSATIFLAIEDIDVVHIVTFPRRTSLASISFRLRGTMRDPPLRLVNSLSIPRIIVVLAPRSAVVIGGAEWWG